MREIAVGILSSWMAVVGCVAGLTSSPQSQSRLDTASAAAWQELSSLPAGTPLVIYLKNGARRQESLVRVTGQELVTHVGPIQASDIAAVSLFRKERLWDGTLRGSGIGVGITSIITASVADKGEDAWAAATVFGLAVGAGFGALFDAAVAMPDKQVFLDAPPGSARSGVRHWTLRVRPEHLSAWVLEKTVHIMLKDGTYLRGKVRGGNEGSIMLAVREASDGSTGKEDRMIPASDVGTVIVREKIGGSVAAAAVGGVLAGLWGGAALGALSADAANKGPGALLGAGLGTLVVTTGAVGGTDHLNWREITLIVQ